MGDAGDVQDIPQTHNGFATFAPALDFYRPLALDTRLSTTGTHPVHRLVCREGVSPVGHMRASRTASQPVRSSRTWDISPHLLASVCFLFTSLLFTAPLVDAVVATSALSLFVLPGAAFLSVTEFAASGAGTLAQVIAVFGIVVASVTLFTIHTVCMCVRGKMCGSISERQFLCYSPMGFGLRHVPVLVF
jgi:hypothetical protein